MIFIRLNANLLAYALLFCVFRFPKVSLRYDVFFGFAGTKLKLKYGYDV